MKLNQQTNLVIPAQKPRNPTKQKRATIKHKDKRKEQINKPPKEFLE